MSAYNVRCLINSNYYKPIYIQLHNMRMFNDRDLLPRLYIFILGQLISILVFNTRRGG